MLDFLDDHHEGEDSGLWPLVRSLNPSAEGLLLRMEHDHAEITPTIVALKGAVHRYADDGGTPTREALTAAMAALRAVLNPHLHRGEMMPIVATTLANVRWESFNQEHYVKPKSKAELGREGHWLIDSLDQAGYEIVVGNVPPIPRFVLLHAFASQYVRACAARWGPEVSVSPLPA